MSAPRILVFDSGIGGLSVAAEIRAALPAAELIYVADDAAFPYGDWEEAGLREHIVALMDRLIGDHRPDVVVIACHTASTLVLPPLRARHTIPFVGTVPAIKPAAERTRSGLITVLATPGTIRRDYTRGLIESFAKDVTVNLVGSARLAGMAEAFMRGEAVADAEIAAEIAPAFVEAGDKRTDMVVLACTHYPFLLPQFARLAPWQVEWVDPAPAIAQRVVTVVSGQGGSSGKAGGRAVLTSGRTWSAALLPQLDALQLTAERSPGLVTGGNTAPGAPV
jgi:glutamate racemase